MKPFFQNFFTLLTDFIRGAAVTFRAAGEFAVTTRYWRYSVIPLIISLVCYVGLGLVFWIYVMPWVYGLLPEAKSGSFTIFVYALRWLVAIVSFIIVFTVFLLTFTSVCILVTAPFVDQLALVYERDCYGVDFKFSGLKAFFSYCWTSAINSARAGLKIIFWSVVLFPLSMLIPYAGFLLPAAVVGYYFGITFLLYSSEHRRLPYSVFKQHLQGSKMLIAGMGMVIYLAMFIPFLAIIVLPVAVLAGTIIFNEDILPRYKNRKTNEDNPKINP